jgi:hypothetical protein
MTTPERLAAQATFAFIKRVGAAAFEEEAFAKLQLEGCADVADVAERVCLKFPYWGVHAEQVCLFLAAGGGEVPPPPAMLAAAAADPSARLGEGLTLAHAGITPGAWLLARVPPPAAAPGASAAAHDRHLRFAPSFSHRHASSPPHL